MRWQQRDRIDGKRLGIRTTQTKMELGMGYAWSKRTTLQANIRFDISGDGDSEFSMTCLYKLSSRFSVENNQRKGGDATNEANMNNH